MHFIKSLIVSKFARTSGQVFLYRVLGAAFSFSINVVLARTFGATGAGTIFLALTISSIAGIIGRLGMDLTLLRFVAASADQHDWPQTKWLYQKGVSIVLVSSTIVSATIILSADWLAFSIFSQPDLVAPLQILACGVPLFALLNIHAELLKAIRWPRAAVLIQGIAIPLSTIILLPLLVARFWINGAAGAFVFSYILVLICAILVWQHATPNIRHIQPGTSSNRLMVVAMPLMVISIMNAIIDMTDTLMIGHFLDAESVGLFGVAQRVAGISALLLAAVNTTLAPEFSSLWAKGDRDGLSVLARKSTLTMLIIATVLFFGIFVFAPKILSIFGAEFSAARNVLITLALGQFVVLATGPVAYLLMMTGHEKFHRSNVVACAVLNILLNIILIPPYGIQGVALATATSLTIKNVVAVIYVRILLGIKVLV